MVYIQSPFIVTDDWFICYAMHISFIGYVIKVNTWLAVYTVQFACKMKASNRWHSHPHDQCAAPALIFGTANANNAFPNYVLLFHESFYQRKTYSNRIHWNCNSANKEIKIHTLFPVYSQRVQGICIR